jgi:hypothetical protein
MSGRRLAVVLIICLVTVAGCSNKDGVPGGILPREKMEQVMWDMAQADQYAALYVVKDSAHIDRKAETMRLYEEVFRLHQVTREQFRKSYRYYLDHPALSQLLFDSVISRGIRARSETYDRPGQYHPPAGPSAAKVPNEVGGGTTPGRSSAVRSGSAIPERPGVSGAGGSMVPGRPGVAVPGTPVQGRPGVKMPATQAPGAAGGRVMPGAAGDAMRRSQEAARKRDSVIRAMQMRRDTTRGRP